MLSLFGAGILRRMPPHAMRMKSTSAPVRFLWRRRTKSQFASLGTPSHEKHPAEPVQFGTHGASATPFEHRVILVSTDLAQNEYVRLATTGQKATVRLTAHSMESKSDLTFGGASVGPNGDWAPRVYFLSP
jgi:hypothetical protein